MSTEARGLPALARTRRLADAIALLDAAPRPIVAGATDLFATGAGARPHATLLDASAIDELRGVGIEVDAGRTVLRIGAATTWSELRDAALPPGLEAIAQAAGEVGGRQVQNRATIGGNVCNASPAADGIVALLALDAQVELAGPEGRRRLRLDDFVLGARRTALGERELLVALRVALPSPRARSAFVKLGLRRYLVISVVMAAVAVDVDEQGRVGACAVVVGACAARARRIVALERALCGRPAALLARLERDEVEAALVSSLSPIDDVRGSAGHRIDAASEMVVRALRAIATPAA